MVDQTSVEPITITDTFVITEQYGAFTIIIIITITITITIAIAITIHPHR